MSQLINITTDSFQAVRFAQNARLVPEQSLDIERRKAIARHYAFTTRNSSGTHTQQVSQINSAFSGSPASAAVSKSAVENTMAVPTSASVSHTRIEASKSVKASPVISQPIHASEPAENNDLASTVPTVAEFNYHAQRGSFEMRVANGSLSYVPQLTMTIVTQRPEVHVEYLGGFNYFPASAAPENQQINLFI